MSDTHDFSETDPLEPVGAGVAATDPTLGDDEAVAADVVAAGAVAGRDQEEDYDDATVYGWTYLAVLFVLFGVLGAIAYGCDSDEVSTVDTTATTEVAADDGNDAAADLTPVAITATIDGDQVVLTGAVPDEGARRQLVDLAEARYGEGNVVDELTVDETTTLADGTFSVAGTAAEGDSIPQALQDDAAGTLGLSAGDFDVTFEAAPVVLAPVDAEIAIGPDSVVLTGELPDQASVDGLVTQATETWSDRNVDGSGLTVGETTWDGGTVALTGTLEAGDTSGSAFASAIAALTTGATIDDSGLTVDTSAEALTQVEDDLRALLEANPILFALGSAEIDPASDEILIQAAETILATPGIDIEIVGHTDNQGSEAINQPLSQDRAEAVRTRLIELGVEEARLTARGAGSSDPVADNATPEGQAANRRIAFEFEGAE